MQGRNAQKCGPRPSVPRNRRNSSRVRSERAGARPLGPRGRGRAAAGRVDGGRRARAQIPGGRVAGLGEALSDAFYVTVVQTSPRRPLTVPYTPPRPSMRQRRPTRTPRRPDRISRRGSGSRWRRKGAQDGQERRPEHRDELHLAGYPRRQGQCHGVFSCLPTDRR